MQVLNGGEDVILILVSGGLDCVILLQSAENIVMMMQPPQLHITQQSTQIISLPIKKKSKVTREHHTYFHFEGLWIEDTATLPSPLF